MKVAEVKELTDKELVEKIESETTALTKLKLSHAVSPLDNPNKIRETRKTIARLNTELTQRKNTNKK